MTRDDIMACNLIFDMQDNLLNVSRSEELKQRKLFFEKK
jgi:hypothetical protein